MRRGVFFAGAAVLIVAVAGLGFLVAIFGGHRGSVVEVPDLAGLSRDDATRRGREAGLAVEVADSRHDAARPAGTVMQQDPAPGVEVRPGRTIRVVISLGGESLTVPDVVGRSAREADLELRRDGWTLGDEARVASLSAPAGTILAQSPAAGSTAAPGTRIHRLVSDGPRATRWVMPDLTGRPAETADRWVEAHGLRKGAVRRSAAEGRVPGTVVGQLPLAGYPIGLRDVVELTLAE